MGNDTGIQVRSKGTVVGEIKDRDRRLRSPHPYESSMIGTWCRKEEVRKWAVDHTATAGFNKADAESKKGISPGAFRFES